MSFGSPQRVSPVLRDTLRDSEASSFRRLVTDGSPEESAKQISADMYGFAMDVARRWWASPSKSWEALHGIVRAVTETRPSLVICDGISMGVLDNAEVVLRREGVETFRIKLRSDSVFFERVNDGEEILPDSFSSDRIWRAVRGRH